MNQLEMRLLQETVGDEMPSLRIRSGTQLDTGRWWRPSPIWLCVVGDELIMLAVARRRYVARVALADCRASHYSHATGELVVETAKPLEVSRFAMSPADALRLLRIIDPQFALSEETGSVPSATSSED